MALIRLRPEHEIEGKAKAVCEAVKARWDEPELSHIIRAHAAVPDLLVAHASAWRTTMDPGVWDRATKEMIATAVSGVNVCEY